MTPVPGEQAGTGFASRPLAAAERPPFRDQFFGTLRATVGRYGWLMLDQTVFAATNLILNVLFAHWLTPSEYGQFGLSFSGFILLSVLHWFVVVEPLLVESARISPEQTRSYVITLVKAHGLMLAGGVVLCAIAFPVARACGAPGTANGIVAAGIGGFGILALTTARRLCLVFLSAAFSAQIGILYLLAATATAWLLHVAGVISWMALWAVMGGWSLAGAGAIAVILLRKTRSTQPYTLRDLVRATSRYTVWGTCSAGISWLRSDGMYVFLALSQGLPAVAQTRAIVTLTGPVVQVNSALMASWLVDFGRTGTNKRMLRHTVLQRTAFYGLAAGAGLLLAWLLDGWITHLVYGGKYDAGAGMMPLFLLACAMNGVEGMLTSAMKAGTVLRDGYIPQIMGSITVGILAATMIPRAGVSWAALSVLAGALVGLAIAFSLFIRGTRPHA